MLASFRWTEAAPDEADWTLLYRYEGRQIVRARYYVDGAHARAAAGLT